MIGIRFLFCARFIFSSFIKLILFVVSYSSYFAFCVTWRRIILLRIIRFLIYLILFLHFNFTSSLCNLFYSNVFLCCIKITVFCNTFNCLWSEICQTEQRSFVFPLEVNFVFRCIQGGLPNFVWGLVESRKADFKEKIFLQLNIPNSNLKNPIFMFSLIFLNSILNDQSSFWKN